MKNLLGFMRWQLDQFRKVSWNFIVYLSIIAVMIVGIFMQTDTAPVIMGITLDMWLIGAGAVAWFVWMSVLILQMQYGNYIYERQRIMRELEREHL
jgi:hypothetical protein